MRIEVSVPGIRKERGKLPAPTRLCAELADPALCEPVTGVEVSVSVAAEHPVNTAIIKIMTVRLRE
jgi:hypothetical protein